MDYYGSKNHKECDKEHKKPKGILFGCGVGGFVDLSNMPTNGTVLAHVDVDTAYLRKPLVKIDFNSVLSYNLNMLEELDLIFTLYRSNCRGEMTELASWPWKVLMDQTVTNEEEEAYAFVILEKNETFAVSFCDELSCEGRYTYQMKVEANYFNITNAIIQSSLLSALAISTAEETKKDDCEENGEIEHERAW